jgi:hypothetical protein
MAIPNYRDIQPVASIYRGESAFTTAGLDRSQISFGFSFPTRMVLPDVNPSTYTKPRFRRDCLAVMMVMRGVLCRMFESLSWTTNSLYRNCLRMFLDSHDGMTICGEAADGLEGIRKAFELKPDVILPDLSMPTLDRCPDR